MSKTRRRKLTKGNKYFRSEFNRLWDALYRWTVVHGLPGWEETESGMLPPTAKDPVVPFQPFVQGTETKTLGIYPGWFNAPKSADTDHEIPDYYLYPWMPEINSVALNHASPNVLALTDEATNFVYLEVNLVKRSATMGASDYSSGNTLGDGMTVWVAAASGGYSITDSATATHVHAITSDGDPSHDHTGFTNTSDDGVNSSTDTDHTHGISSVTHQHSAQLNADQLGYHINSGIPPEFKVIATGSDFPKNVNDTVIKIPWGKFVMGEDGAVTSMEWYWTGNRDWNPDTWIQSSVTSGDEGDDDQAQNPKIT